MKKILDISLGLFLHSTLLTASENNYKEILDTKLTKQFNSVIIVPEFSNDLIKRKILPALYSLTKRGMRGLIIGMTDKDKNSCLSSKDIIENAKFISDKDEATNKTFQEMLVCYQVDIKNLKDFVELEKFIKKEEEKRKLDDIRIVYLANVPETFNRFTDLFVQSGIIQSNNPNHMIGYDKPIGWNMKSAKETIKNVEKKLSKKQIFFTDHYTAKKIVSSIPELISSNNFLKSCWSNKYIKEVKIFINEMIGVEDRGAFYDKYGVLKDMVQNHILQLVTFVALADHMSNEPSKAQLERTKLINSLIVSDGYFGQYKGYLQESGVSPKSKRDTLAFIKFYIDNEQWKGVPFYTQVGKKMAGKSSQIQIIFKNTKAIEEKFKNKFNLDFKENLNSEKSDTNKNYANLLSSPATNTTSKQIEADTTPKQSENLKLSNNIDIAQNQSENLETSFVIHMSPKQFIEMNLIVNKNKIHLTSPILSKFSDYDYMFEDMLLQKHSLDVSEKEIEAQWNIINKILTKKFPLKIY